MATLNCVTHTFLMKYIFAVAIYFGLLGSLTAHAQSIGGNAEAPLVLKEAGSLGEAASQTALQTNPAGAQLPEIDSTPLTLKASDSFVGVPLAEIMPPVAPQPATATMPVPSTPPAVTPQTSEKQTVLGEDETDEGARFGIAPIQWGGDVSETLRWRRYTTVSPASATSSLDNMQIINLRASSYIWQPWIATVDGGVGLLHSSQSTNASASSASNTLTGNGALSLFPRSRFPFRASYDVSDSRTSTSSDTFSGDYSSKRLGLSQVYRTISGESNLSLDVDRSTLSSSSFGEDTVTSMNGTYSARFGNSHTAGMTALHRESSQQGGISGLGLNSATARHSYRLDSQLTVDTSASLTDTVFNTQTLGVASNSTSRYLQANSFASWRPDEDKPLYINGGLHFFDGATNFGVANSNTQSVGGNLTANYNPTRNISLNASGNVTRTDSGSVSNLTTVESGNAAYNADVIKFGKDISYNWNVSGSLTNQTSSNSTNNQNISGSGSHSLYYPYIISAGSALNFTANQALSSTYDKLYGMNNTIIHNASMSWNGAQTESLSGSANSTVGDAHTFGYSESNYQYANFQLNGRRQFSINSSLSANGGISWNRQGLTGRTTTSINGSVTYLHTRVFNVRGLRYSLIGNVNTMSYDERLLGNVEAKRTQSGYSIDQHLNYRIGKLDTSLSGNLSRFDGRENASIYVRIGRFFGNM